MSSITTHRPLTRSLASLVFVLLLLAPLAGAPAAARNKHALAYPPNAKVAGKTYGEWAAAWWQWAFSIPAADHPLLVDSLAAGDRCDVDQPKQVFFLGGVFNVSGEAERSCTIRPGTTLFFPIFNFEADNYLCVNPDTNFEVSDLRDLAKANIDTATNLALEVDGKAVDMSRNRFTSPTFAVTLPEDNLLQAVGVPMRCRRRTSRSSTTATKWRSTRCRRANTPSTSMGPCPTSGSPSTSPIT